MTGVFSRLVEDGVDEIVRRHGTYLSRHVVCTGAFHKAAQEYRKLPRFAGCTSTTLEEAAARCAAALEERGVTVDRGATAIDPIGQVLLETAIDAHAAERRDLDLRPTAAAGQDALAAVIARDYDERVSSRGVRYFIRRTGSHPLVLTTATGIAGHVWLRLLADPPHDFRPIVVESRTGDCLLGGVRAFAPLETDGADILAVLDEERLARVHVLGWCNGCSVAIDLALRAPQRIGRVVLLSPTLWEAGGAVPGSPFQADMHTIFSAVVQQPALAPSCVGIIKQEVQSRIAPAASGAPLEPGPLFSLPDAGCTMDLFAPMSTPAALVLYSQRITADASFRATAKVARVSLPVLVIVGTHDHIVNERQTRKTLAAVDSIAGYALVTGAGHYIQDLQYPYLRWLLERFLAQQEVPQSTARVRMSASARTTGAAGGRAVAATGGTR